MKRNKSYFLKQKKRKRIANLQYVDVSEFKGITIEGIKNALEGFWKEQKAKEIRQPSVTHHVWEENGVRYSAWKIDTGTSIMWTGDKGKEMFDKAMMNRGFAIPEHLKTKPES